MSQSESKFICSVCGKVLNAEKPPKECSDCGEWDSFENVQE